MKESVKAALWSIFIFPGSGHFYLKKPLVGTFAAGMTIAALVVILAKMMERASQIADKIVTGEVPLDLAVITELVSKQSEMDQSLGVEMASYALLAIWVVAAIDAYRLGRIKDRKP